MVFLLAFLKVYAKAHISTIHPIQMHEGKTAKYVYMLVNVIIEKFRYINAATVCLTGASYENRYCHGSDCVSDAGLRICYHASALWRH
ncbi:hypothetical protein DP180_16470 [Enterobacter kobei]|uniref:Secreted protein n=1 Tax=Enterobacter kobei TaxID=208224 RepID=A0A2J0PM37_9ENTR|nr:hypothetical protein CAL36_13260 [Enterobacter kobei]POV57841.1 hypothetical protein C3379_03475 [Enterobacter cloacae complex sp. ECNIH10]POV84157.1 hypothetical protein C3382_03475 [Enterobacter cloacae complex sp. ECNIH9]PYZ32299.1 hypothetical protein DNK77_08600 [Enterobacter cloacae complex sp.]RGD12290.1 hypothetical protein DW197_11775 [Enterobacter sp. AM17-18]